MNHHHHHHHRLSCVHCRHSRYSRHVYLDLGHLLTSRLMTTLIGCCRSHVLVIVTQFCNDGHLLTSRQTASSIGCRCRHVTLTQFCIYITPRTSWSTSRLSRPTASLIGCCCRHVPPVTQFHCYGNLLTSWLTSRLTSWLTLTTLSGCCCRHVTTPVDQSPCPRSSRKPRALCRSSAAETGSCNGKISAMLALIIVMSDKQWFKSVVK